MFPGSSWIRAVRQWTHSPMKTSSADCVLTAHHIPHCTGLDWREVVTTTAAQWATMHVGSLQDSY